MTRLVILADTHMPSGRRELASVILHEIERADAVIHLGDFTDESIADRLEQLGPLYAVHGNNDSEALQARFPPVEYLSIEGRRFALIHGDIGGKTALTAARSVPAADAVLFGHSHRPYCRREGNRLLFNPGSPTDRRFGPHRAFGIIEVRETIEARVVLL